MEDGKNTPYWFASPVYARYWQHYQQAMSWHQRHRRAYRKALEDPALRHPPHRPQRYADWQGAGTRGEVQREGAGKSRMEEEEDTEGAGDGETDEESGDETDEDAEIECDVSNMEITEELRQYFAQTERHREELKRQQLEEEQRSSSYADTRGSQAPLQRPGERRGAEMKKLYGEDAARIQGMETAVQLTFDRNCDRKEPKYWPVIPLNL